MSALADILPDLTKQPVALAIARRAIRKDTEDAGLSDRLRLTAVEKDGKAYYRPYAAARAWLKANPRWLIQSGQDKWRDLEHALSGLAEDQAALDGALGLVIPDHLKTDDGGGAPGPTFARLP